ncbi:auxilin-related protein 1-like [Hibiscus syriacus]|uniref:auxilin-related protein 1-like n=1 Tax=Hibiscus syriacus TaxID=106335 RepID=UPI001922240F|nr:auxilin-related protein 1-like [Hibiscus syriacus]
MVVVMLASTYCYLSPQLALWPECGWQPVFLTDLITAAAVKKAYRKATLCIHPDKVQQKGANLLQKYISEKVFDLLKEAWNKFNSERSCSELRFVVVTFLKVHHSAMLWIQMQGCSSSYRSLYL